MNCYLRPLDDKHLDLVLKWRNSDRVRKYMFNDNIIAYKEHIQWYNRIKSGDTEQNLIFFLNTHPMGLVSIKEIDHQHRHCVWGFYIGEDDAPKGSGLALGYLGLKYCVNELKLNKVSGEVLAGNVASKKLHEKLGFVQEGFLRKHILKGDVFHDIVRYGLLLEDWTLKELEIESELKNKGMFVK